MKTIALLLLAAAAPTLRAVPPGEGLVMVIIGPPGSGKSTQAEYLRRKYQIPVISADDLRAKSGSGDAQLNSAIRSRVKEMDASKGFILDGYPSTRAQADYLNALVKEMKLPPPVILDLSVPDDIVRQRLSGKENPDQLEKRLADYHREMDLFRKMYPEADIWTVIGTRTPAEVSRTIVSLIQDRQ
jgi:adenylate kinase